MRVSSAITAGLLGLALVAGASPVFAQQRVSDDPRLNGDSTAFSEQRTLPRRALSWLRGRIGLDVDTAAPPPPVNVVRPDDARSLNQVEAGAYYRVSPRLRVGVTAPVAQDDVETRVGEADRRSQPRVRLETIFKF